MLLSKSFLLKAVPGAKFFCNGVPLRLDTEWVFYNSGKEAEISFDSRSVVRASIFFALKGQRVDGHNFLTQALQNGAAYQHGNLDEVLGRKRAVWTAK